MTKRSMRDVSPNRFYSPSATHCNTLQHPATHCNTLQHTATHCNIRCPFISCVLVYCVSLHLLCLNLAHRPSIKGTKLLFIVIKAIIIIPLQHTATHCNTHCKAHCDSLKGRQCNISRPFLHIYLCLSASTVRAVCALSLQTCQLATATVTRRSLHKFWCSRPGSQTDVVLQCVAMWCSVLQCVAV